MIDTLIGVLGMMMILLAFIFENTGHFEKRGIIYNLLNLVGSVMLIIYAISTESPVFIALNVVWAIVAIFFLVKRHYKR